MMLLQSPKLSPQVILGAIMFMTLAFSETCSAYERADWTASKLRGTPEPPRPYIVERVYPKLEFKQPVEILSLADTGRMILMEVGGKIYTFVDDEECSQADEALDLVPRIDQFARAFAIGVHPKFRENRQIFVVYSGNPIARPDGTRLSRFQMTESVPPMIDPDSEEILLNWPSGGHNGCAIRFDSHGYLYFSAGDGSRPFPPDEYNVSQDLSDLRSTICRIDVDHREGDRNYRIPPDNPFLGLAGVRPEVWAFGFRNPWRFSIDPPTQAMICGDVGWELWELIYHVERGGNYGWSIFEGPQMIRSDIAPGPSPIRPPLFAYPHTDGLSITGGPIYRGRALKELEGTYIYGDFVNGKIWGLRFEGEKVTWQAELASTDLPIITFSQDRQGELLVMSFGGTIHRLVKNPEPDRSSAFPRKLSETGLFVDTIKLEPSPGVVPYRIQATAFEDGASSSYVVGLPDTGSIELKQQKRQWVYPKDAVFAKTISMPLSNFAATALRRLETQILHFDGRNWNPYSYIWNEQQTDADLVGPAGTNIEFSPDRPSPPTPLPKDEERGVKNLDSPIGVDRERGLNDLASPNKTTWRVHSRGECMSCHNSPSGTIAGWDFANLAGPSQTSPDRSQLDELERLAIITGNIKPAWKSYRMNDPADESASLDVRARSYLSINCSHCHCRGGGGTVALELPFSNSLDKLNAINELPTQGTFGIENARVIEPGDPYSSVLYYRLATCGAGRMPKLWARENDTLGLQLVHDWIASMDETLFADTHARQPSDKSINVPEKKVYSTNDALREFHRLLSGNLEPHDRKKLVKRLLDTGDPVVRGLVDRFIPKSERIQRLGTNIDRQKILALRGDLQQGSRRYRESAAMQCRNCHRIAGLGQSVGPDLDGIARKRSREDLLDSLIEPSRRIEPEFQSHTILTSDGTTITGLLIERSERGMTLRSADGKSHAIAAEDIEQTHALGVSLMPTGIVGEMTAEELADLLAYLESLR